MRRALRPAGGVIGARLDERRWPRPARPAWPGDELRVDSEVLEARPSTSRPDHALVGGRTTRFNQNGKAVQIFVASRVPRRPASVLQRPAVSRR